MIEQKSGKVRIIGITEQMKDILSEYLQNYISINHRCPDYYNYMLYEQQMMNMKPQGYYEWEWSKQYIHLANGKYVGFSFFINYTIFKKHPTEYPIIDTLLTLSNKVL